MSFYCTILLFHITNVVFSEELQLGRRLISGICVIFFQKRKLLWRGSLTKEYSHSRSHRLHLIISTPDSMLVRWSSNCEVSRNDFRNWRAEQYLPIITSVSQFEKDLRYWITSNVSDYTLLVWFNIDPPHRIERYCQQMVRSRETKQLFMLF